MISNKINEEVRQHRLFKIQTAESKIREYKKVHEKIKEKLIIKTSKNLSISLIRILLVIITILITTISLLYFFPEKLIEFITLTGKSLTKSESDGIYLNAKFFSFALLILSLISLYISFILKKNIDNRNNIFKLNNLIKEVIEYMETISKEEKEKYEYFIEFIQEIENAKLELNNTPR
jgi:hypothetical protein